MNEKFLIVLQRNFRRKIYWLRDKPYYFKLLGSMVCIYVEKSKSFYYILDADS